MEFIELMNKPVIDSIKEYIVNLIQTRTQNWKISVFEGAIGVGKSTIINMISTLCTKVPEPALSDRVKPELKKFYKGEITPLEFQYIIEKEYFYVLCELLENNHENIPIILD